MLCHGSCQIRDDRNTNTSLPSCIVSPDSSIGGDEEGGTYFERSFIVLGVLGRGSFGEVYRVQSKVDRREYAVKKMKRHCRGRHERSVMAHEVEMTAFAARARPEYVVQVFSAWEEDNQLYLCMELCGEGSLADLLENIPPTMSDGKGLKEEFIWNVALDLILALQALHSYSFVHLDVKPGNCFLVSSKHGSISVKLGDFGLTTEFGFVEEGREGDSRYLAPEFLKSTSAGVEVDGSADMFSLGCMLFEMGAHVALPGGGSLWHTLRDGSDLSSYLQHRSPELQHLIQVLLSPQPHARPTTDQLLSGIETLHHMLVERHGGPLPLNHGVEKPPRAPHGGSHGHPGLPLPPYPHGHHPPSHQQHLHPHSHSQSQSHSHRTPPPPTNASSSSSPSSSAPLAASSASSREEGSTGSSYLHAVPLTSTGYKEPSPAASDVMDISLDGDDFFDDDDVASFVGEEETQSEGFDMPVSMLRRFTDRDDLAASIGPKNLLSEFDATSSEDEA